MSGTPSSALVVGMGVTGAAVTAALTRRGCRVTVVDDHPTDASRARAESLGVTLLEAPTGARSWEELASVETVLPSPGVPDSHPVLAAAARTGATVASELDLAADWDSRPVVAITGTNGKTTVTTLVTEALERSGVAAVAAGNTDLPLVAAIESDEPEVFVVEASSFRLGRSQRFRPAVATWLNFADDHLDVHASLESYEAAKARIWEGMDPDAIAIAGADDPAVLRHVPPGGHTVTFGLDGAVRPGHWTVVDRRLISPDGQILAAVDELGRSAPHDIANALAAAATALAAGASLKGVREALLDFEGLAHRVELVAEYDGVRYYDDSKSTTPHATISAVRGFERVVLIAGGRNKGLDLSPLATVRDRLSAVVAIGEAAPEIEQVFVGRVRAERAASMADAVSEANRLAAAGDVVLLSPACASFDSYSSYAERGDDFAARVRSLGGDRQ